MIHPDLLNLPARKARLHTSEYKLVKEIDLPEGPLPPVIVDGSKVYSYYVHTEAVGYSSTGHESTIGVSTKVHPYWETPHVSTPPNAYYVNCLLFRY